MKASVGAALVAALLTVFEHSIMETLSGRLPEPPLQNKVGFSILITYRFDEHEEIYAQPQRRRFCLMS